MLSFYFFVSTTLPLEYINFVGLAHPPDPLCCLATVPDPEDEICEVNIPPQWTHVTSTFVII